GYTRIFGELTVESVYSLRALGLDDLITYRVSHELADAVNFELTHDIGAMRLRGLHADSEHRGDFLAAAAFRKQLHDFPLSRGEAIGRQFVQRPLWPGRIEIVQHDLGGLRSEKRFVFGKSLERHDQVAVGVGLHNVTAHADFENVANQLIGVVNRKN